MKKTGYIVCKDLPFSDSYRVFEVRVIAKSANMVWFDFSAEEKERRNKLSLVYLENRSINEVYKAFPFYDVMPLSDYFSTREAADKEAEKRNLRLRLKDLEERVQALEDRKSKDLRL